MALTGRTSIVIVNWNTCRLLGRCLEQVRRWTAEPCELVVVDNGSRDGSPEALRREEARGARVVLLPENLGFAGGSNRGIAAARGERVCLLNTDALVTRGWLVSLERCMDRSGAGLVGPCTDRARGRQRRRLLLGRFPPPWRRTEETESLSFFCVLIRREVLDQVGPLDERFGPGTFEDDDYCRRARRAGFRLMIDGRAWVWHESHATFRANGLDEAAVRVRNRQVYEEKWSSPGGAPR